MKNSVVFMFNPPILLRSNHQDNKAIQEGQTDSAVNCSSLNSINYFFELSSALSIRLPLNWALCPPSLNIIVLSKSDMPEPIIFE